MLGWLLLLHLRDGHQRVHVSPPCLNGASTCTQGVDSYTCTRATCGERGHACGHMLCFVAELDECSSVPCLNGGTCLEYSFTYSCACVS